METVARLADMLAKGDLYMSDIGKNQNFGLSKYLSLAPIFAFFNFSFGKFDSKMIEMPRKIAGLHFNRKECISIFEEMRNNLPELSICFQNKLNYRLDFDLIYSIIQPWVKTGFITEREKKAVINATFIMIQNGITLCSQNGEGKIEASSGVSRGVVFEPRFEKFLVYRVFFIINFFLGLSSSRFCE